MSVASAAVMSSFSGGLEEPFRDPAPIHSLHLRRWLLILTPLREPPPEAPDPQEEKVRRTIVLLSVLALSGCAEKTYRTGTIFVDGFNVDTYRSGRPMSVRQDVVMHVTEELAIDLNRSILEDSRLYAAPSCESGTYRLAGTISRIETAPSYELKCRGKLFRCDDGTEIDEFAVSAEKDDLDGAIASLAEGIVAEIRETSGR
jgi:hypothetical protein